MADYVLVRKSRNIASNLVHIFLNILLGVGKTIVNALWGAIKAAFSALVNDPVGVTNTFVMVIGSIFVYKKLK